MMANDALDLELCFKLIHDDNAPTRERRDAYRVLWEQAENKLRRIEQHVANMRAGYNKMNKLLDEQASQNELSKVLTQNPEAVKAALMKLLEGKRRMEG